LSEFPDKLFVYGTLRPGSKNEHAQRLAENARHIGLATMSGRLYRLGDYLVLAPSQSKEERVTGDVFEGITAELFERLDEYEGADYCRQLGEVTMDDGRTLTAYCYRYALLEEVQSPLPQEGDFHQ
jgi:gamma-glutamylcyclotransferase (GGCT)/AIG2-like uncharacterized protein YtfP